MNNICLLALITMVALGLQGCNDCQSSDATFSLEITEEPYPSAATMTADGETVDLECAETNVGYFLCEHELSTDAEITGVSITLEGSEIELDTSTIAYDSGAECGMDGRYLMAYPGESSLL